MKRIVASVLCILLLAASLPAVANTVTGDVCILSDEGELLTYWGEFEEVFRIPAQIDGKQVRLLATEMFYARPLNTVYIDNGIEIIEDGCFAKSTLLYIDLPESVQSVGERAFADCKGLASLSIASDDITFGKDALAGTGYLHIAVPCTADLLSLHDRIYDAKGDDEFAFDVMHVALVESMEEKDIFGHAILRCDACGYQTSTYLGDEPVPFEDVPRDAWYYDYVQTAYLFGIISGKSETLFDPGANMTLAEAAKIAACVHMYLAGTEDTLEPKDGEKWYAPYVAYCYDSKIIDSHLVFDWEKNATRGEMAYLFSRADDGKFLPNADVPLSDIPDVDESTPFALDILALYRRGIAVGSNEYYAYYPDSFVKRSEAAAFISRIICYDMRISLPKG